MNIHHLELFYYVAKFGGVSAAARHIPYGIQQPAISAQVISLEDSLGVTLFHRRPFSLTKEGEKLYQFIEPFFSQLPVIHKELRGGKVERLRIGAPPAIQHNYLPKVMRHMKQKFPEMHFTLTTGWQSDFEKLLLAQEIDIAFTSHYGDSPSGIKTLELKKVELGLLVREDSPIEHAEQLWKLDRIDEPLLAVETPYPVTTIFLNELQKRKIEWYPTLQPASLGLIAKYVAEGFGIGVTLNLSDIQIPKGTRLLPLKNFPKVSFVAMWLGNPNDMIQMVLKQAKQVGKLLKERL